MSNSTSNSNILASFDDIDLIVKELVARNYTTDQAVQLAAGILAAGDGSVFHALLEANAGSLA